MKINLLEALVQVPDFRALRGRRYPLWLILLLVIMGKDSGHSYKPDGAFGFAPKCLTQYLDFCAKAKGPNCSNSGNCFR
jgi:hypothetical protein